MDVISNIIDILETKEFAYLAILVDDEIIDAMVIILTDENFPVSTTLDPRRISVVRHGTVLPDGYSSISVDDGKHITYTQGLVNRFFD